jgi:hypothetical protein
MMWVKLLLGGGGFSQRDELVLTHEHLAQEQSRVFTVAEVVVGVTHTVREIEASSVSA